MKEVYRSAVALVTGLSSIGSFAALDGHWEGQIDVPGSPIRIKVDLRREGDSWHGTIDIPAQGARQVPLYRIKVRELDAETVSVRFAIQGVPGAPTFEGRLNQTVIAGKFKQAGASVPFRLSREVSSPNRPQHPKPPFPYSIEEISLSNGELRLAGTLTVPLGDGPFPAVLLVSGSGLQDRDETVFDHKPFWVIADHLSRSGVVVLRMDDAGAGESAPHPSPPTTIDFASDAASAVDYLGADPRVATIGLVGHSEGGTIASLLASTRDDIGFIILLAAGGVPGADLLRRQNERTFAAAGVPQSLQRKRMALLDQLFDVLVSDALAKDIEASVTRIVRDQLKLAGVLAEQMPEEQIRASVAQAMTPWMRFFLAYDPRPVFTQIDVPVLALNGELDVQVDGEQNLPAIRAALMEGGNSDVTTVLLPGLNHLFQRAKTGLPNEYREIEETIAPQVLETIRDWILVQSSE